MKVMKILHVVMGMGMGGIETFLINVYRNIDRSAIQFDFIIHKKAEDGFENEIRALGGSIFYFNPISAEGIDRYRRDVKHFIQEHNEYSIIHIHNRVTSAIWAYYAKKNNRISIVHSHNTGNGLKRIDLLKNIVQYPSRYLADYCMGCSQQANEWMFGKRRANGKTCFIVRNGIDIDKYVFCNIKREKVRKELNIDDSCFAIGTVGRLVPQKNYDLLIDAFALAIKRRKDIKLFIVGDGPLHGQLEEKIATYGLCDSARMLGKRYDVNELLEAFDCFALTSTYEGLGIVLIEAQAEDLPIMISSAVSEEACIMENIIRIETYEVNAWADAMIHIERKSRYDRRKAIHDAGYDIKAVSNWLCDFYRSNMPIGGNK